MKTTHNDCRIFRGLKALERYIQCFQPPLVALPKGLNPFWHDKVEILLCLASQTPLGNIKFLPVYGMLEAAQKAGKLKGVTIAVEGSSGNTAAILGVLARQFGIERVKAIVPRDLAMGKLEVLRLLGVEVIFDDFIPGTGSTADKARAMGEMPGHINLGQYENEANPMSIQKWLAPWIDKQTNGEVDVIAAGLGTTGTALGLHMYFKHRAAIVGVNLLPGNSIPGLRTMKCIEKDIRFNWESALAARVEVGRKESFEKSLRLVQEGYLAGPSSGSALVGLLKFLEEQRNIGTLKQFRNKHGNVVIVVICPDGPGPYQEKYASELDPEQLQYLAGEM
jgi:cysteine synthase